MMQNSKLKVYLLSSRHTATILSILFHSGGVAARWPGSGTGKASQYIQRPPHPGRETASEGHHAWIQTLSRVLVAKPILNGITDYDWCEKVYTTVVFGRINLIPVPSERTRLCTARLTNELMPSQPFLGQRSIQ